MSLSECGIRTVPPPRTVLSTVRRTKYGENRSLTVSRTGTDRLPPPSPNLNDIIVLSLGLGLIFGTAQLCLTRTPTSMLYASYCEMCASWLFITAVVA